MSKIYLQEKIEGTPGQYVVVGEDGFLKAGELTTEARPELIITAPVGTEPSDFSIHCNGVAKTVTINKESSTLFTCSLPEFGLWSISINYNNTNLIEYIDVTDIKMYTVMLTPVAALSILENASWSDIKTIVDSGLTSSYWSVGDRKSIVLKNGTFGTITFNNNYTIYAYIIGIDHNAGIEGAGVTFQLGFPSASSTKNYAFIDEFYDTVQSSDNKSFHMIRTNTTPHGWNDSLMRPLLNSRTDCNLYDLLPDDLQAVISSKLIYTDNGTTSSYKATDVTATTDNIFLLSEYEVLGQRTNASNYEYLLQAQYDYYKSYSKIKYKYNAPSSKCGYWTRSRSLTSSTNYGWCRINTNGESETASGRYSKGVAPAFFIGSDIPTSTNIYISTAGSSTTDTAYRSSYIYIDGKGPYYSVRKLLVNVGSVIDIYGKRKSSSYPLKGVRINGSVPSSGNTASTSNTSYTKMYSYTVQNTGVIYIDLVYTNSTTNNDTTQYVNIITS